MPDFGPWLPDMVTPACCGVIMFTQSQTDMRLLARSLTQRLHLMDGVAAGHSRIKRAQRCCFQAMRRAFIGSAVALGLHNMPLQQQDGGGSANYGI